MKNYKKYAVYAAALSMVLSIGLAPVSGFAREKENERGEKENRTKKSICFRAYGHMFAPGWIKNNASTTIGANCWFPFGLHKKFRGPDNATSTPPVKDVKAPVLSSIYSLPRENEVTIRWATDERADSTVFYALSGASLDVNSSSTAHVGKLALTRDHVIALKNLATSTVYYFKVKSTDSAGNTSYSNVESFTTKTPNVTVKYPVVSNIATVVGTSTISVLWKTNEPATSKVYYGTSSAVSDASLVTNHSMVISGLATSTVYDLTIESKNASGNTTLSNSFTITTKSGL